MRVIQSVDPRQTGTSSREAFAALDEAKAQELKAAIEVRLADEDDVREAVDSLTPYPVHIVVETLGTGGEIHAEAFGNGRIHIWTSEPVLWFEPSEIPALISALVAAANDAQAILDAE